MTSVQDKVVLITGAASGLGLADAQVLSEQGARVVMTDIDAVRGADLAAQLGATFLRQDVADEGRWTEVMDIVKAEHGRLDGIVNNAGIAPIADIEATTTDMWRQTLAVHLDGTYFGCRAAIQLMKESGGGSIVNMSSTAALVGIPDYLAYSAAKGGIRAMTKAIAVHCRRAKLGIRCNSVHPGSINTPMVQNAVKQLMDIDLDDNAEKKRKAMGIGEPRDVAHMVVYLLSDESKHVNGAEMVVDNADTVI
ncbi:MAG: short-chain dehydrogenase [Gammaproteobacteria bacterium]|nr:short-chain dehydrogenase [Gammaproteobacteria bacterium]|tara:strand:+ start:4311 stop:5063 length:753 start_codon:yes stop_codon:yes gene_type:complete